MTINENALDQHIDFNHKARFIFICGVSKYNTKTSIMCYKNNFTSPDWYSLTVIPIFNIEVIGEMGTSENYHFPPTYSN